MAKSKSKSVEVVIPELSDLPLDPDTASTLDAICCQIRACNEQIKLMEKGDVNSTEDNRFIGKEDLVKELKKLVARLESEGRALPERLLGDVWDLRRTVRETETINRSRLLSRLAEEGFTITVKCPTVVSVEGVLVVCPQCHGTGERILEGLHAASALLDECTDRSTSVSWAVWERRADKEEIP